MYSFSQPSPAEVDVYLRRTRAERSRVICGFFRRLASLFSRRPLHPALPVKTA